MTRLTGILCCLPPLLLVLAGTTAAQGDGEYLTCYNYTWTGKNQSVDCEENKLDIMNEPQPCLYTLIYTVPPDLPPNTTDLHLQCTAVQKCPSYTCKTKGKRCIQLMWYDITNTLVNYSSFCGSVTDVTNPEKRKEVQEDVEYEMEVGTYTKKLRVCQTHLCNTAGPLDSPGGLVLLMVLLAMLTRLGLLKVERGHG